LEGDPADQKNSRLGVFRFGQLDFRPVEANCGQIVAQCFVCTVKPSLRGGELLGEILSHADNLSALAGE
jgi:hypothetical protein